MPLGAPPDNLDVIACSRTVEGGTTTVGVGIGADVGIGIDPMGTNLLTFQLRVERERAIEFTIAHRIDSR